VRLISVKQAAIDVRAGAAPLLVVAAGTFAGLAPVLGLDTWVSPAAAVVALLSGASVIRADVLAPARARAAARAVRPLRVRGGGTEYRSVANALQIAAGVWAAPAHVLRSPGAGQYEVVLPDGGTIGLTPCHRSADHDFAVFRSGSDWPWTARPQWGPAEPGERISLVGWLVGSAVSAVQATVDLTAQESQVPGLIAMIGPAPPAGSLRFGSRGCQDRPGGRHPHRCRSTRPAPTGARGRRYGSRDRRAAGSRTRAVAVRGGPSGGPAALRRRLIKALVPDEIPGAAHE
jgi:hypothetical protein